MTLVLAAPVIAMVTACATNPATGERQLNLLSEDREIAMGAEAAPQYAEAGGGVLDAPSVDAAVKRVGMTLAKLSERPDLPWEFNVLNSGQINAFALPGGKIFIYRGLLEQMSNEAQLAAVLGHEIGHVTAKHINDRLVHQMVLQGAAAGVAIAGDAADNDYLRYSGAVVSIGGGLTLLKFSRDDESQSDTLGLRYMTEAGYNPVGMLQLMEILDRASAGSGQVEWLASHPLPVTRIEQVAAEIRKDYPGYDEPGRYRFYQERFEREVLEPLSQLPPPPKAQN